MHVKESSAQRSSSGRIRGFTRFVSLIIEYTAILTAET